jgi:hypothetical protein
MLSNIDEKLANEELAKLDAEFKKLIAIKEKRNAIAALKKELYPEANNTAARIVLGIVPNVMQTAVKGKSPNKRAQIAAFAEDYIKLHGATVTRDLVKAIINNGLGELLAGRDNKVVAVSQALGDLKDVFGTDRTRGWFLVETELKVGSTMSVAEIFNKDDAVNSLFTTSDASK